MASLSTTAWVVHDLGLATALGGSLFGRMALHPAVKSITNEHERGVVVQEAWRKFNTFNLLCMGTAAATWLIGRSFISGREVGQDVRNLVALKDVLMAGSFATGIGSMLTGRGMAYASELEGPPIESGSEPSAQTPPQVRTLQRATNVLGPLHILLTAGVLGVTTVLAMKSGESSRWKFLSNLLP